MVCCSKDLENNVLIAVQGHNHPLLFKQSLKAIELSWCAGFAPTENFKCAAKVRYRQQDQVCEVTVNADGSVDVVFDEPQER